MILSIQDLMRMTQDRLEHLFHLFLQNTPASSSLLNEAMFYAVSNGGKRVRPLLVYSAGYLLDAPWENLDLPACAIELIHSYSLIHDDLPAMDNADIRRGKPACHKQFDEAMAILAGDALQPLALEIVASHPSSLNDRQRLAMIQQLCHASGLHGMAAGQALDMIGVTSENDLLNMYRLKTGVLFSASAELGLLASPAYSSAVSSNLKKYADALGLAFQLQDDLLDLETHAHDTGKPKALDISNNKLTYAAFAGASATSQAIEDLFAVAIDSLSEFGNKANPLRELVYLLLQRKK